MGHGDTAIVDVRIGVVRDGDSAALGVCEVRERDDGEHYLVRQAERVPLASARDRLGELRDGIRNRGHAEAAIAVRGDDLAGSLRGGFPGLIQITATKTELVEGMDRVLRAHRLRIQPGELEDEMKALRGHFRRVPRDDGYVDGVVEYSPAEGSRDGLVMAVATAILGGGRASPHIPPQQQCRDGSVAEGSSESPATSGPELIHNSAYWEGRALDALAGIAYEAEVQFGGQAKVAAAEGIYRVLHRGAVSHYLEEFIEETLGKSTCALHPNGCLPLR